MFPENIVSIVFPVDFIIPQTTHSLNLIMKMPKAIFWNSSWIVLKMQWMIPQCVFWRRRPDHHTAYVPTEMFLPMHAYRISHLELSICCKGLIFGALDIVLVLYKPESLCDSQKVTIWEKKLRKVQSPLVTWSVAVQSSSQSTFLFLLILTIYTELKWISKYF